MCFYFRAGHTLSPLPHIVVGRDISLELTVMARNTKIKPLYTSHNQGRSKIYGSSKQQQQDMTK